MQRATTMSRSQRLLRGTLRGARFVVRACREVCVPCAQIVPCARIERPRHAVPAGTRCEAETVGRVEVGNARVSLPSEGARLALCEGERERERKVTWC